MRWPLITTSTAPSLGSASSPSRAWHPTSVLCIGLSHLLSEIPVGDLAAVHEYGVGARAQIINQLGEKIDAVGHPRQMRVERNGEHARLSEIGNLSLEGANGLADAQLHLGCGML